MAAGLDLVHTLVVVLTYSSCFPVTAPQTSNPFIGTNFTVQIGEQNVPVISYQGIRYAQARTAANRFQRPVIHNPSGTNIPAQTPPNNCFQSLYAGSINSNINMSEDCLFLNLWVPVCGNVSEPKHTMVWIHGGFLASGASTYYLYNGSRLAARECVIVASMNYRTGIFGFLSMNHTDAPGNVGLLDVYTAVQWLRANIVRFGGSADRITLMGGGSGAFIAATFLISPLTNGMVQRIIMQSGGLYMNMHHQSQESALNIANRVAASLNCNSPQISDVINCLRQVGASELHEAYMSLSGGLSRMVSVIDDYYLSCFPYPRQSNCTIRDIPMLLGYNRNEETEVLDKLLPNNYRRTLAQPIHASEDVMYQVMHTSLAGPFQQVFVSHVVTVLKVIYRYESYKPYENASFAFMGAIIRDFAYACPIRYLAKRAPGNVYFYNFNHPNDDIKVPRWIGVTHGQEIQYVFEVPLQRWDIIFTDREILLSSRLQRLWANFAKYGNPSNTREWNLIWPQYQANGNRTIVEFTESADITIGQLPNRRLCNYWDTMPREMRN